MALFVQFVDERTLDIQFHVPVEEPVRIDPIRLEILAGYSQGVALHPGIDNQVEDVIVLDEENLEALVRLLETAGKHLDGEKMRPVSAAYQLHSGPAPSLSTDAEVFFRPLERCFRLPGR